MKIGVVTAVGETMIDVRADTELSVWCATNLTGHDNLNAGPDGYIRVTTNTTGK